MDVYILCTLCSTYFFDHVFVYCVRILSFWFEPTLIASPIQWWFDETLCHHDDEPMNKFCLCLWENHTKRDAFKNV